MFECSDRNWIDKSRLPILLNRTLKGMEGKRIAFMKTMPDGRVKIFKRYYCCLGIDEWKRCPEYRCPLWPDFDSECPHFPHKTRPELRDTLDISLSMGLGE